MRLLSLEPSHDGTHKWRATFLLDTGRTKTTHFGARGMSDFTLHKDRRRRQLYLARHRPTEDWNDPTSAGALSRWLLWEYPSMNQALRAFKARFHLGE